MKFLVCLLFSSFIFMTAKSQDMDLSEQGSNFPEWRSNSQSIIIANKIKTETIYAYSPSKKNVDSVKTGEITYDSLGNITSKKIFPANFTWLSSALDSIIRDTMTTSYIYTPNNELQKIVNVFGTTSFVYDILGNKTLQIDCNKDTTALTLTKFVYDDKSRLIETYRQYIHDNKNVFIEKYRELNDSAFQLSKKYYYDNGKMKEIQEYGVAPYRIKIDSNGMKTESEHKSIISATYTYKLNSKNNYKVAYWNHSLSGQNISDKYIFNDSNQVIEFIMNTVQPVVYINQENNSLYKKEYRVQESMENKYTYNSNGTLFQTVQEVIGKTKEIRKHYYTYY